MKLRTIRISALDMKKNLIIYLMFLTLISLYSCDDNDNPIVIPTIGNVTVGNETIEYKIENTSLFVGDTFRIYVSKNTSLDTGVILYLNDDVMVEIKSFPYTFEKIMSTAGKYKLTVSAGFIDEYGNIKVSVDSSSNYDIEVQ